MFSELPSEIFIKIIEQSSIASLDSFDKEDHYPITNLRLVSHEFEIIATPLCFRRVRVRNSLNLEELVNSRLWPCVRQIICARLSDMANSPRFTAQAVASPLRMIRVEDFDVERNSPAPFEILQTDALDSVFLHDNHLQPWRTIIESVKRFNASPKFTKLRIVSTAFNKNPVHIPKDKMMVMGRIFSPSNSGDAENRAFQQIEVLHLGVLLPAADQKILSINLAKSMKRLVEVGWATTASNSGGPLRPWRFARWQIIRGSDGQVDAQMFPNHN